MTATDTVDLALALHDARQALAAGDALRAVDRLQELPPEAHSIASRQLLAHALLRAGALAEARVQLDRLAAAGHEDEETLGLIARVAKGRWQQGDARALPVARDAYRRAWERTGGWWTGLNAATLTLIADGVGPARELARRLQPAVDVAAREDGADFWARAARAELALLQGDEDAAFERYREAVAASPGAHGHHRSARDNAALILQALGRPASLLARAFPVPVVVAFSGHNLDTLSRASARFPEADEPAVAAAIEAAIREHDVAVGLSAAACGADLLFLEALHAAGRETHVVLPHPPQEFRRISVTDIGGPAWGRRFDEALAHAGQVTVLAPHAGEDLSYQFHGAASAGLARLRAEAIGGRALGLAYWDGRMGGVGGTGSIVAEWRQHGFDVRVLPFLRPVEAPPSAPPGDVRQAGQQRVVSILFADAVGFSRLGEQQVRAFVDEFWGRIAAVLQRVPGERRLSTNTWGDALFLIVDGATDAAEAALAMSELVAATDWRAHGLPVETQLRIALHAGPVSVVHDPILQRPGYTGMHVSRAARIEPVTPPGSVYVSEAFAALLAFDDDARRFRCEYVGTVPLAKQYGRLRTWRLTRRTLR